jgi:hypothetical protein
MDPRTNLNTQRRLGIGSRSSKKHACDARSQPDLFFHYLFPVNMLFGDDQSITPLHSGIIPISPCCFRILPSDSQAPVTQSSAEQHCNDLKHTADPFFTKPDTTAAVHLLPFTHASTLKNKVPNQKVQYEIEKNTLCARSG